MKRKTIFLAVIFFPLACHAQIEFYSGSTFKFPLKEEKGNGTVKYDTGAKFHFGNVSAAWISGIGTETFHSIASSSPSEFEKLQKYRYGVKYRLPLKDVNMDFLAGTLCFSQGISRLRRPSFYIPGALKEPSLLAPGISPALPSWTSGKTPAAASAVFSPAKRHSVLPTLQFSVLETEEVYASVFKRFSAPFIPSASISFSGGLFEYGRENTTSWFQKQRAFTTEKRAALETEANLVFPHLRISTAAGIHESPFGGNCCWARSQNFILLQDFTLHFFYYIADAPLITADRTESRTKRQAGINPQYTFWFGKTSADTGLLFYTAEKLTDKTIPETVKDHGTKAALNISSGIFRLSSSAGIIHYGESGGKEKSAQLKLNWKLRNFSAAANCSYKKEENGKQTGTFTAGIYPQKILMTQASAGLSLSELNGNFQLTPTAGVGFKGGNKKIKWNIKTTFTGSLEK
ncbi:hypothetical protein [Treponema sp.]|uniref:hypothetical protein n=1 Tax=Treponema sp. TaxID=166 RepID=UPI003EFFEBEC